MPMLAKIKWRPGPKEVIPAEIIALAQKRQQARVEKRWADADQLRDQIMAAGYLVEDTPQGPQIRAKKPKRK